MQIDENDLKTDVRVLQEKVETGQRNVTDRLTRIEDKLDKAQNVPVGVFDDYKKEVKEVLDTKASKEDVSNLKWLVRLIAGALVTIAIYLTQQALSK